jgi:leucyl-tRNA synthetase
VMRDLGLASVDEPFTRLLTQGMVLNEIFYRKGGEGRITYYNPADIDLSVDDKGQRAGAVLRADGKPVQSDGIGTMSKSKNNGVDPQMLIEEYGADTARFFMMFASPPEQTLEWSDSGVEGSYRFLRRLWEFCYRNASSIAFPKEIQRISDWSAEDNLFRQKRFEIHQILQQANYDYGRFQYNTVASAGMKILNVLEKLPTDTAPLDPTTNKRPINARLQLMNEGVGILLRIIHPIVPHITHTLWHELRYESTDGDITQAPWPEVDESALVQDEIELVLQVNGKLRGHMRAPKSAGREELEKMALAHDAVARHTNGQPVRKVVVVPGRLVNVVV